MTSQTPDLYLGNRRRLADRLRTNLSAQRRLHRNPNTDLIDLQELEADIQAIASQLEPAAPEIAIIAARRDQVSQRIAGELCARARLPRHPDPTPEPVRLRIQHLERKILDRARQLEPEEPEKAITRATSIASKHLRERRWRRRHYGDPSDDLDQALDRLPDVSRRLEICCTRPQPTAHQRARQILQDLCHLDLLEDQHRDVSGRRSRLPFRGNVIELRRALNRTTAPSELLKESAARIFRYPGLANRAMVDHTRRQGLQSTLERLGNDPAAFGKLRSVHILGAIKSPQRAKALALIRRLSDHASRSLVRRTQLKSDLDDAVEYQHIQTETKEILRALPSRQDLLTDLGRYMERLELHELRPLLQPDQAALLPEVRIAEQQFLEPLRQASRSFPALEQTTPKTLPKARDIAGLFQQAPGHVLKRLTQPQMQVVMVAVAIVKRRPKSPSG